MISLRNGAELSSCGNYRWVLARPIDVPGMPNADELPLYEPISAEALRLGTVLWIMLNPSTADAQVDDPTIRRVRQFTRLWGYCRALVVNLFAWRATEPQALLHVGDPVGMRNDVWIARACESASLVVAAWGGVREVRKMVDPRASRVVTQVRQTHDIHALAYTAEGAPRHPLYLVSDLRPLLWIPRKTTP